MHMKDGAPRITGEYGHTEPREIESGAGSRTPIAIHTRAHVHTKQKLAIKRVRKRATTKKKKKRRRGREATRQLRCRCAEK